MRVEFGTDGVRGEANTELTPENALALGYAAAAILRSGDWLIGWDTRQSSTMLGSAFAAGVASAGTEITQLGVIPTAGVAYLGRTTGRPSAMVTASHNPYHDNGIKIFAADGQKLPDPVERAIEAEIERMSGAQRPTETGRIHWNCEPDLRDGYRDWLIGRARQIDGSRLRIGLDCAHGAAYEIAPKAIAATGAQVTVIGNEPDGRNINNEVGSTHLDKLRELVQSGQLDLGLALDGDADRLLAISEIGKPVDGDEIIAILARRRAKRETLAGKGVVVTSWSNLGLLHGLRDAGIAVEVCEVGDRFVAKAMENTGYVLGGEQSGHIIIKDILPVGDGISTAIELLAAVAEAKSSLSDLASAAMHKNPQRTVPVAVELPPREVASRLHEDVLAINAKLGENGRLVLRPSGTEKVVRIMAEAETDDQVDDLIAHVSGLVTALNKDQATLPFQSMR